MRYLITAHPGSGHVLPSLALAGMLRERGHDVAVATGPAYRSTVENAGHAFLAAGPDWNESDVQPPEDWRMISEIAPPQFIRDLTPIVEGWQPDVLVHEESEFSGWIVAEAQGIPHATLCLGLNITPANAPPEMLRRFERWRARAGAPSDPVASTLHRYLCLDQYPSSWVTPDERPGPVWHSIGPALFAPARAPLPSVERPSRSRPLVYCTLGTVYNRRPALLRLVLAALAELEVDVVATVGPHVETSDLAPADNVRVERFVPQAEVLPDCSAVVCHAGMGTVMGALWFGVPLVTIPIGANQNRVSRLAGRAGVAVPILGENPRPGFMNQGPWADLETVREEDVRSAVRRVLADAAMRERARAVGAELRQRWQSGRAARLLEELATTRAPIHAGADGER